MHSYASPFESEKPRRKHLIAAAGALFFSVLVHVWVIGNLPPLPIGQSASALESLQKHIPLQLREQNPGTLKAVDKPDRFNMEDPTQVKEVAEELREFTQILDDVIPDEAFTDTEPDLKGEGAATADASPPEERAAFSARQEIIQINEDVYSDRVELMPNQYVSGAGRAGEAPDIALPVDVAMMDLGAASRNDQFTKSVLHDPPPRTSVLGPPSLGNPIPGPPAIDIEEPPDFIDEPLPDPTEPEPLDELLDMSIHTFKDAADDYTYFRIDVRRHGNANLPVVAKDVLFILDSSYSMTQSKLDLCKEGVEKWMRRLNPDDRFNIIAFRDEVIWCFNDWKRIDPVTKTMGLHFLEKLRAKGKTDVFASLQPLLSLEMDPNRPVISVLITDGRPTMGLVDSSDIIQTFSRINGGKVSVFTLGGGKKVNRFLLDMLSYSNRGDSNVVEANENLPAAIDFWGAKLGQPVLTTLDYRFSGMNESEIYPRTLMHLFLDRSLVILGRVPNLSQEVAFQIVGNSGGKVHDMVFKLDFEQARQGAPDIRTQWAWHKVHHLIGQHIKTKDPKIIEELNALADTYKIIIPYSSDIAPRF